MNKLIFFFLFAIISINATAQSSIYSFKLTSLEGTEIDFNTFRGKKILIVNTASQGEEESQLAELEQLYQQFKDSGLVVIAFPSNDFGNEVKSNKQIKISYASNYNITFPIAGRGSVSGASIAPLYTWLTQKGQNGKMNWPVKKDFEKFLINANGQLVAAYRNIRPMSPIIVGAIRVN